eukprot:TRINITY_DN55826_c0_g1_i1.p1 TRINITY_DN55826_c0_g1~~TRINITY_DN55826_c0_g1_i1.p1  ORF type:complete len:432 (+),score=79.46 TRINITY_DN55826_c0_g1_i1:102-1397(+)
MVSSRWGTLRRALEQMTSPVQCMAPEQRLLRGLVLCMREHCVQVNLEVDKLREENRRLQAHAEQLQSVEQRRRGSASGAAAKPAGATEQEDALRAQVETLTAAVRRLRGERDGAAKGQARATDERNRTLQRLGRYQIRLVARDEAHDRAELTAAYFHSVALHLMPRWIRALQTAAPAPSSRPSSAEKHPDRLPTLHRANNKKADVTSGQMMALARRGMRPGLTQSSSVPLISGLTESSTNSGPHHQGEEESHSFTRGRKERKGRGRDEEDSMHGSPRHSLAQQSPQNARGASPRGLQHSPPGVQHTPSGVQHTPPPRPHLPPNQSQSGGMQLGPSMATAPQRPPLPHNTSLSGLPYAAARPGLQPSTSQSSGLGMVPRPPLERRTSKEAVTTSGRLKRDSGASTGKFDTVPSARDLLAQRAMATHRLSLST